MTTKQSSISSGDCSTRLSTRCGGDDGKGTSKRVQNNDACVARGKTSVFCGKGTHYHVLDRPSGEFKRAQNFHDVRVSNDTALNIRLVLQDM